MPDGSVGDSARPIDGASPGIPPTGDAYKPGAPPSPLDESSVAPIREAVAAALSPIFDYDNSFQIVDAENGQVIYERNPNRTLRPASNTKLFTTAAALDLFGLDHRMETVVHADRSGTEVTGDLVAIVHHDTFNPLVYPSNEFAMHALAGLISELGVSKVNGAVHLKGEMVFDGSSVGTGFAGSTDSHRALALSALQAGLSKANISAGGGSDSSAGFAPPEGLAELVRWPSPPIEVAASATNVVSHNLFADMMMRAIGEHFGTANSYAAGFAEVKPWLASLGARTDGLSISDGSGLSYENRVSASHITGLYQAMNTVPAWRAWSHGMAIAGVRGTIASRMTGNPTKGRFYGKTGTLLRESTIALGGMLKHPYDGHRYYASFISNISYDSSSARNSMKAAMDAAVTALAKHKRAAAARPAAPTLRWVRNDRNGATISIDWLEVEHADGYRVWFSEDGVRWSWAGSRLVTRSPFRADDIPRDAPLFVRVTATFAGGESEASDVYPVRAAATPSSILLVDANDRWQAQPTSENAAAFSHDFLINYPAGLGSAAFDTVDNDALDAFGPLDDYAVVIWAAGEEGEEHESFDEAEQRLIREYVASGGALLASGAEVAFDLDRKGGASTTFLREVLHANYADDDAQTWTFAATQAPTEVFHFHSPAQMVVDYPDKITPSEGGERWLSYVGGAGGTAAVRSKGSMRVVFVGFPIESIARQSSRRQLLEQALLYLTAP